MSAIPRGASALRHCALDADIIGAPDPSALRVRIRPIGRDGARAPACFATFDIDRPSSEAIDLAQNICERLQRRDDAPPLADLWIGGPAPRPHWLTALIGLGYVLAGGGVMLCGLVAAGVVPMALGCGS